MRRNRPLALITLLVASLAGCHRPGEVADLGTRAVVIAIDGADWKIIEQLAAEDAMPNLSRLRARGTSGPIATLPDISLSPVIWTSVATGMTPVKHGVTWFMVDRPDGTRVPIRSHNRKVKALWNILADHRRRATVIGWWATYPAESIGKGLLVSDALGFHGFGATALDEDAARKTHPASLFERVNALVPAEQQISPEFARRFLHLSAEEYRRQMFDPGRFPKRDPRNPVHLFQQYAVTAEGYTAIAEELLAEPYDLLLVYYEQVDSFSHLFMKYAPPRLEWIEPAEFERYRDVVSSWYSYQDELLGRLLAQIDLESTAVFVLSDHGFKSGERRIRSETTVDVRRAHLDHEREGIFIAAGPHVRKGAEIQGASVLDLAPTVLHYLGFRVAKDMDGKVLEDLFEDGFRDRHPIRYVASYEPAEPVSPAELAVEGTAGEPATMPAESFSEDELADTEAALRALGYLDETDVTPGELDAAEAEGAESSPEVHNNLGRVHLRNGDLDEARAEFEKALALDPRNADALLNLGSISAARGRVAEAEYYVKRALQLDPNSIAALAQLAEIRRGQGDLDGAVRLFEEALAIDDSQPFLQLGYGDVLQRAGRLDEAEGAFRSVLELDPDSFKARYDLGVTLANQGRIAEAVAMYRQALEIDPDNPEAAKARNNLGAIFLAQGDRDAAREHFEAAVRASPVNLESRYNLALLEFEDGRLDAAVALLEQAATLQPNHEQVNASLGMAYLHAGRGEEAYRSLLLVRRLYPGNWLASLGLAVLHARAGQEEQAQELLDEALRRGGEPARERASGYPVLAGLLE